MLAKTWKTLIQPNKAEPPYKANCTQFLSLLNIFCTGWLWLWIFDDNMSGSLSASRVHFPVQHFYGAVH